VLKPAGYSTYMCGKWHVTANANPQGPRANWPRKRGFDRYYGTVKGGGSYYDPAVLCRDDTPITPLSDPEYKPQSFYYTDAIADNSARFIREHHENVGEKPLFLYVAFTSPHWPLHAPADTVTKYKGKYDAGYEPIRAARFAKQKSLGLIDEKSSLSPQAEDWNAVERKDWEARCMEVYAAQVDRMDQGIGRILAALERTRQLDDTLVIFLADNGACAEDIPQDVTIDELVENLMIARRTTRSGEPVHFGNDIRRMPGPENTYQSYGVAWANLSNAPFRLYKHWIHEGGIATPLIAHWPNGIAEKGGLRHAPGYLPDIMATILDAAGATYPAEFQGRRIEPLEGQTLLPVFARDGLENRKPMFWEHEGNAAVRIGQWKLVKRWPRPWELYDMDADRTELHDLAALQPERVADMAAQYEAWAERCGVIPREKIVALMQRQGVTRAFWEKDEA